MQKKIKGFINSSIMMAATFAILGIIFIVFPEASLDLIRWIIAIFFIGAGSYMLAASYSNKKQTVFGGTVLGTILLIIGLVFAVNPGVMDIFPIVIGAWCIVSSVSTLRYTTALGKNTPAARMSMISSVISIICGIILVINPWGAQIAMMTFVGIMILIYAISSLSNLITIKRNFNTATKEFKKAKEIVEAEIVDKKEEK